MSEIEEGVLSLQLEFAAWGYVCMCVSVCVVVWYLWTHVIQDWVNICESSLTLLDSCMLWTVQPPSVWSG